MPKYTLYLDVWLLRLGCNFLFEYLLLWATATVTRTRTNPRRLLLASSVGTFHYLLYLLASLGLIPFYGLLRFFPIIILVSLLMVIVAFYPAIRRKLFSVLGYFYGIGFAAAGAGMASAYLLGSIEAPRFLLGMVVSIFTILLIAELGWGIVHERMVKRVYQIPLQISCNGVVIKTTALIDTGNQLKDPVNQKPVIIVEQRALTSLLPAELTSILANLKENARALDSLSQITVWQTRIRLIPFRSIGESNGLLVGFRPDEVKIANQPIANELHPTIAIHPDSLDPQGEYSALVPAVIVENPLHPLDLNLEEGGETHAKAASVER